MELKDYSKAKVRALSYGVTMLRNAVAAALVLFGVSSCAEQSGEQSREQSHTETKTTSPKEDVDAMVLRHDSSTQQATSKYMPNGRPSKIWQEYNLAADKALKVNDYESAVFLLDEAIKLAPNEGELYNTRGRARAMSCSGNDVAALEDLTKARGLGTLNAGGYAYMGRLYDSQHETGKAIEVLSEGAKKYPGSKDVHLARAALYVASGQRVKAEADYNRALQIGPDTTTHILRGQLLESLGKPEQALKDYEAAATKTSKKGETVEKRSLAHRARAALLAKMGRHKQALDAINQLDDKDKDDESMRFRGDQYAALKQYDKAIAEYTKSIESAQDFARPAYEARAKVYEALGKSDLAQADRVAAKRLQDAPAEKTLYSAR